jgi:hypothetical protein
VVADHGHWAVHEVLGPSVLAGNACVAVVVNVTAEMLQVAGRWKGGLDGQAPLVPENSRLAGRSLPAVSSGDMVLPSSHVVTNC